MAQLPVVRWLVTVLLALGLLLGCAPSARLADQAEGSAVAASKTGPKLLRVGMITGREPESGIALGAGGIGGAEHTFTFHAGLTTYDALGNLLPRAAQKVPTVEDGDWLVFPDGRMEVTWKLRPNLKWQDGTPATAQDFAFGITILRDREIPFGQSQITRLLSEVATPDAATLVLTFAQPYTLANASGPTDLPAVPNHILRELYDRGEKQAVINSPYWTKEFVGLGPYRLTDWVLGSHLEAVAFDDYVAGRPRIDRLVIRYVGDARVLYANLVTGAVDVVPFGSFQANDFILVKEKWAATGAGTALAVFSGTRNYRFQLRDPTAPWSDLRTRRALIHLLDRQALADSLVDGLSGPADTLVAPSDPIYPLVEQRGLPKYAFDPSLAQRLLGEAGWGRAPDGSYRSTLGQPLTIEVRSNDRQDNVTEAQAVAAQWKAAGLETSTTLIPDRASSAIINEMRHTFPGVLGGPLRDTHQALDAFITVQTGTEANRWIGNNRGGYSNTRFDQRYAQSLITFNLSERQGLMADLLKQEAEEAVSIHLFYSMAQQTVAFRRGVRGPGMTASVQLASMWNVDTWEIDN